MSEQNHQKKLITQLENEGWYVIKLIKTNKNGIADLLALKKGEEPFFIEVKGEKGVESPLQKFRIREQQKLGFRAEFNYEPNKLVLSKKVKKLITRII